MASAPDAYIVLVCGACFAVVLLDESCDGCPGCGHDWGIEDGLDADGLTERTGMSEIGLMQMLED